MNRRLNIAAAFVALVLVLLCVAVVAGETRLLVAQIRLVNCRTFVDEYGGSNLECRAQGRRRP